MKIENQPTGNSTENFNLNFILTCNTYTLLDEWPGQWRNLFFWTKKIENIKSVVLSPEILK